MTVVVNTHNDEQEKVLLAFLDSLQYDYQTDTNSPLTKEQEEEVLKREKDFSEGKITSRPWDDIRNDLEKIYR
jgi:hypothetical protein